MIRTYALIGDPVGHSLSPAVHNAAFRHLGMDSAYIAYRIPSGELEYGIESLREIGIAGFNVTMPHKVDMMGYLDSADENCSVVGACNTVSVSGGSLRGHNTDVDGFMDPIRQRGIGVSDVLILGAGGAARAAVLGLSRDRAGSITICGRTPSRAEALAGMAESMGVRARHTTLEGIGPLSGYSLIVNATPVGMNGEPSLLDFGALDPGCAVYDMVYRPMRTDMMARAKKAGAKIVYGYEMMLGQAVRSFELWHGREAPYGVMKRSLLGGF